MMISPTTILLLMGGNVIALGFFIYGLNELTALRANKAMREVDGIVDREKVTTRRLLEEQREKSFSKAS